VLDWKKMERRRGNRRECLIFCIFGSIFKKEGREIKTLLYHIFAWFHFYEVMGRKKLCNLNFH